MPSTKPAGTANKRLLEERAHVVLSLWDQHLGLSYDETIASLRAHYKAAGKPIGKTAAEQAYSRALDLLHDKFSSPAWTERVGQRYLQLAEKAEKRGDITNARKALDSFRHHMGLGSPERVQHSGSVATPTKFADLSDDQLRVLAVLDQGTEET